MVGPSGAVAPGAREPWGPVGGSAWGPFTQNDIYFCYPQPRSVTERLRLYPQRSAGNTLRDPLPVPFTADEVVAALKALPKGNRIFDRVCSRVDPAHVHIALAVLPIIESRNGGWIDFTWARRENPYVKYPSAPRSNVFNLRCLLNRLPGKPLPPIDAAPCNYEQPRRLEALYNIADVRTTFAAATAVPSPGGHIPGLPGPRPIGPGPDGPGGDAPYGWPPPAEFYGLQLEEELPPPEPFSFSLFDLFQSHDIKGA